MADRFTDPGQTMQMWRMAQQVAKQHGTYGLFAPSQQKAPAKPQAMRQAPAKPPPAVPLPPFPGGK